MIFRKKVKAGILLYAMLMLAVFSLLLQFYLRSQEALAQAHLASRESSQAYFMAQLTMDNVSLKTDKMVSGKVSFSEGDSRYQQTEGQMEVVVSLTSGSTYRYLFPLSGEKP
ncbi:competence protein ComGG [Streptococcus gallolyticus]|uniref:competence type IV pilus minor pilin ComGG n=1 Tax=Streptococcus hepaticus TaxID=3349163 RepID=UPI001C95FBCA|nr:competence protein ComGG [Streptococcus gallolyticus]MBY5040842.1 competence protein ComGG [Streptococcus gallolyticus]